MALSFSDHIMLAQSNSGFYGLRGTARQEMRQMGDCVFDPGRTLVMRKLEGKCATNESLKKLAMAILPEHEVNCMIKNSTGFINVPASRGATTETWSAFHNETSALSKKPSKELFYIWHYADQIKFWPQKGVDLRFPVLRHPLPISCHLATGCNETVRNLHELQESCWPCVWVLNI